MVCLAGLFIWPGCGLADRGESESDIKAVISVYAGEILSANRKTVFGHNLLGYNPCKYKADCPSRKTLKVSILGTGIWDSRNSRPAPDAYRLLDAIHPTSLRFPGGSPSNFYDWKEAIGPAGSRPAYQFGIDEFLSICENLKADPIITLNYFTSTVEDLTHFFAYLNMPFEEGSSRDEVKWARHRAANGRVLPYGARYFELGNELYNGDRLNNRFIAPADYAARYLQVRTALRSINPHARLGAVVQGGPYGLTDWDTAVMEKIRGAVDFGVVHVYPFHLKSEKRGLNAATVFPVAFSSPGQIRRSLEQISRQLQQKAGSQVPLAITEFNMGTLQQRPMALRHTLGNAILVADLLREFILFDHPLLSVNFWHFANSAYGLVHNRDYVNFTGAYRKRPAYFAYQMMRCFQEADIVRSVTVSPAYRSRAYSNVAAAGADFPVHQSNQDSRRRSIFPGMWAGKPFKGIKKIEKSEALELHLGRNSKPYIVLASAKIEVKPGRRYRLSAQLRTTGFKQKAGICLVVTCGFLDNRWSAQTMRVVDSMGDAEVFVDVSPPNGETTLKVSIVKQTGKLIDCPAVSNSVSRQGEQYVNIDRVVIEDTGAADRFPSTPFLSTLAGFDSDRGKVYLLVINKHLHKSIRTAVSIHNIDCENHLAVTTLSGPSIDSGNEGALPLVQLTEKQLRRPASMPFDYSFGPHSLTLFSIPVVRQVHAAGLGKDEVDQ